MMWNNMDLPYIFYKALFEDNDPNGRMIADALTPTVDIDFRLSGRIGAPRLEQLEIFLPQFPIAVRQVKAG